MTNCLWIEDGNGGYRATCTGSRFEFTQDDSPIDNGFKFCPYCGRDLISIDYDAYSQDKLEMELYNAIKEES